MKRTVVITIKYYDNFKEFGTIPVRDRYRYQVIHFIYNFQPGIDGERTRKRWLFLTQKRLGELGRVRNRRRFILRITLFYSCILYYNCRNVCFKIIIMFACIRDHLCWSHDRSRRSANSRLNPSILLFPGCCCLFTRKEIQKNRYIKEQKFLCLAYPTSDTKCKPWGLRGFTTRPL